MSEVGLFTAFLAGLLSISSPCVLPLFPLYLTHLAGTGKDGALPQRRLVMLNSLAFVVGFGLIFVLLGVSLGALGNIFVAYRDWLIRTGGLFMVAMGLHLLGVFRVPLLERTHRLAIPGAGARPGQFSSSFLVGVSFAAGWMPCVGPVLGAILTLAISAADPVRSGALLSAYAAGLAVPFLLAAMALGHFNRPLRKFGTGLNLASGVVMTVVGALMFLGLYQQFFARVVGAAPWTPWEPGL